MSYRFLQLLVSALLLIIACLPFLYGEVWSSGDLGFQLPTPNSNNFDDFTRSPGRSLLSFSPKHSTALVAALDGTIHLVESSSMKVIWSFASGPPIHTSYQAPIGQDIDKENTSGQSTGFFIDCGDDWELYMHTDHFGRMKLSMTIDDFVRNTPFVAEDGAVTLGSKKTTVFDVEPKSGSLIRTYMLSDSPSTGKDDGEQSAMCENVTTNNNQLVESVPVDPKPAELRLQIMRTDYTLKSFSPNSDKISWNMTVAEIGAALLCQDVEIPSSGTLPNLKDKPDNGISSDITLPLSCQSKAIIFRHRNNTLHESFSPESLSGTHHEDTMPPMLPMHAPETMFPLQDKANIHESDDSDTVLPLPHVKIHNGRKPDDLSRRSLKWLNVLYMSFLVVILMVLVISCSDLVVKAKLRNYSLNYSPSKKKKSRKWGKNKVKADKMEKRISSEHDDTLLEIEGDNKNWLNLNKLFESGADGRRIGKLFISNTEIAKGSNGTIVLEGSYEGRPVAVKRLVQAHHDVAFKEIQNLIASDRHANIVRWYGVEYDQDFVYVSLERCTCSLDDLIQISLDSSRYPASRKDYTSRDVIECGSRLESVKSVLPNVNLWKAKGHPSPLLLKLMREMVSGLVHLHELGIIHRDLKPHNVLIIKERYLCAKLSDMGISRRLLGDMSSLGHHATGSGSSGWQAPEQLLHGRQTRAMDLFSLGCLFFFCITGGRHPFGDRLERDINIVKNQMDLFLVEHIPEALDLISCLLSPDPELRPKALEVLHHPLFWSSERRLSFLRDTSDRVEMEDRGTESKLLKALENIGPLALGAKWNEKMEPAFISNIGHYRRYRFDSVRDLLRVMRNKLNHYRELPKEIQELVGPVPDGFDSYFACRFPKLLMEVYKVMCRYCRYEECFQKYFKSNVE